MATSDKAISVKQERSEGDRPRLGDKGDSFLSSHPATQERIQNTKALIAAEHLPPRLCQHDDGKLEIIQHRIRLLTGKAKPR